MSRVAVVGAGVSGLSVALCLTERLGRDAADVTIIAEKFSSQGITSDRAGALMWLSVAYDHHPQRAKYQRWMSLTEEWLKSLNGLESECELQKVPVFVCFEGVVPPPWYSVLHPELKMLSREEIAHHNLPERLNTVWTYESFCINPTKYVQYLSRRFRENCGKMIQRKINSLQDIAEDYDIIINCTGLGARELIGDLSVYPVRGQILEVKGPNIQAAYYNVEPRYRHIAYIIPLNGHLFLGGTADKYNWSTEMDPAQTEAIYRKCVELCPQLEGSEVVGGWAALRPARDSVRLEVDREFKGPSLLIHNYGHGGMGFSASWGCARDVVDLVQNHAPLKPIPNSKL